MHAIPIYEKLLCVVIQKLSTLYNIIIMVVIVSATIPYLEHC